MQKQSASIFRCRLLLLFAASIVVLGLSITGAYAVDTKGLIDLNTASQKDLEGLKGIGPATAKKIIANRPYKSVDELSKAGLSPTAIQALKPFVAVGAATTPAATKPVQMPSSPLKAAEKAAQSKVPAGLIDLNSADQKTLEALPGIGPKTAGEIIKGRPYKSVEDLSKVKGMSKGKIDAIKGMVTVGTQKGVQPSMPSAPAVPELKTTRPSAPSVPATQAPKVPSTKELATSMKLAPGEKININTASKEQLEALPGVGPVKAQAIIDGRPYKSPEDLMKVKGIKEGTFNKIKDFITVK